MTLNPLQHEILTFKDNQYTIEDVQLEKQPAGSTTLPRLLTEQQKLLPIARINKFRKDHYVETDEIKRITPGISRRAIDIVDEPIFVLKCREVNDFPPVAAPPPGKPAQ